VVQKFGAKEGLGTVGLLAALGFGLFAAPLHGQAPSDPNEPAAIFEVEVDLVMLNIAVTDQRGRYIRDLSPRDFRITEDGIEQAIASFGEGNAAPRRVMRTGVRPGVLAPDGEPGIALPEALAGQLVGTNVYVLFDTSNFMYRSLVYAEDAIADFIRGLDRADSIAVYAFSRNLTRHTSLSPGHDDALRGLRRAVAGDETALYNCLLLTLRDAAEVSGRKVIIVFSNGPDNASAVSPDDVGAIAEDEGVPIYVISTRELDRDPISSNAFRRITQRTGGKAYFAKTWQRQSEAFVEIREELTSAYTISYYPQPNPNRGWRSIQVELTGPQQQRYRIRTRSGYRPKL
jgi:VWFA-related protein